MPDNIRVDNFHGFNHAHFSQKGKKYEIKTDNFQKILNILENHLQLCRKIDKKRLLEDLK